MDGGMWGTIVGGILGFLASVLPKVFELIQSYFEHKQSHEANAQQIDAATKGIVVMQGGNVVVQGPVEGEVLAPGIPPDLANTSALDTVAEDVIDSETEKPECTFWVRVFNTLRFSVRPVVTYGFFALFLFIKIQGLLHGMIEDQTPIVQLLPVIWDEGTESLFAAILAFWFGSRAFEKTKALRGA